MNRMRPLRSETGCRFPPAATALALAWLLLAAGCDLIGVDDNDDGPSGGGTVIPVYVAVGDSLTAGIQNLGLKQSWQEDSYPALIARELGTAEFVQPLVADPGIGSPREGVTRLLEPLDYDEDANLIVQRPLDFGPLQALSLLVNYRYPSPYHNLGVAGADAGGLLTFESNRNIILNSSTASLNDLLYYSVLRDDSIIDANFGDTVIEQATSRNADVITLWIGHNDVLGGLSSGGVQTGPGGNVTDPADFEANIEELVSRLLSDTTAEIYLATIPDITGVPLITLIPSSPLDLFADEYAPVLGFDFPDLDQLPRFEFITEDGDTSYILLTALEGILLEGWGLPGFDPIPAEETLSGADVAAVRSIIDAYNIAIEAQAAVDPRVHIVDMDGFFEEIRSGSVPGAEVAIDLNGTIDSGPFSPDGVFSLDGFHLNSRGYRLAADRFLAEIRNMF